MTVNEEDDGFSLVEVLVSFSILVMVVVVSLQIFNSGLRQTSELKARGAAIAIARAELVKLSLEAELASSVRSGNSELGPWKLTVRELAHPEIQGSGSQIRPFYAAFRLTNSSRTDDLPVILDTIVLAHRKLP